MADITQGVLLYLHIDPYNTYIHYEGEASFLRLNFQDDISQTVRGQVPTSWTG